MCWLGAFLEKYAMVRSDLDALAKQAIIDQLAGISYANPVPVRSGAAIKMLEQMLAACGLSQMVPNLGICM